jgi:fermentation-respiration switch protein FrsA (DUF1100 family)
MAIRPSRMRRLLVAAAVLVAGGVAAALGLRSLEHAMLFPAPPPPAQEPRLEAGTGHTFLDTPDGRVEAFLLPGSRSGDAPGPLLIYAHGNGELVDFWLDQFGPLRAAGVSILLVEYPGYGRSTGTPSEASIRRALVAGYDWAVAQPGIDAARVVGHGRSLGGGAVSALGRERPLAALILESTFTSIEDVAADAFRAPRCLVWNAFDNLSFVRGFAGPVLVLHGEVDSSIPVSHARKLAEAAPAAQLLLQRCGHNDCPKPWTHIEAFLRAHGLL